MSNKIRFYIYIGIMLFAGYMIGHCVGKIFGEDVKQLSQWIIVFVFACVFPYIQDSWDVRGQKFIEKESK